MALIFIYVAEVNLQVGLLDIELIDFLKIKLNPLILGTGIKLFGSSKKKILTELVEIKSYDKGLQIINYRLNYKRNE